VNAAAPGLVAVVGNPNTGKSSLFNALTGIRQHVGNYPGVTVERKEGTCLLGSVQVPLVDLPGTYSLNATSVDERIVLDVLLGRVGDEPRPAAALCVVDASNLRRNLFLVSQISELGLPVVVALNMSDEAAARGLRLDPAALSARLGVPVVPTVAPKAEGLDALKAALAAPGRLAPVAWPAAVLEAAAGLPGASEGERLRHLFDVDDPAGAAARERLAAAGTDPVSVEAVLRYRHLDALLEGLVVRADAPAARVPYRIDRVLTHRLWGLLVFAALMFGVFASVFWLADPLVGLVEAGVDGLAGWAGALLEGKPFLQSLVQDGVIKGVGGVLVFLPQILILFLFIALLEDSGYMARAAFLMDKVFGWTGLNGKSFVPMLSSFACAVPSILATRTIEDPKARLGTILVAPLMSCSARIPIYNLMIAAFLKPALGTAGAGLANAGLYLLGLVTAFPVAFLVNRFLFRLRSMPFVLEMPPYRAPHPRSVAWRMWMSGREFVVRAGTVIFAFSIVLWALSYFPRPAEVRVRVEAATASAPPEDRERAVKGAYLEQSWLGRMGRAAQPAFAPAGFDWKLTVAVLSAFPAREVVISTLQILFAVEEDDEHSALRDRMAGAKGADGKPLYSTAVALAVMVFFAYCLQCGSTVAVIARESGWRWAAFAFAYMTGLAWIGAVATYQIGTWMGI
jgi:ferrous iron transport protein B